MKSPAPERLRILHVSEVHWGGVVTLLGHFVEQQVLHGHDVHVLAHPAMPPLHPSATAHQWEIDRARPPSLWSARRELHRLVGELRPDVVHLHSWFAGALGRTPPSLNWCGVPVVYQPHAWSDRLSTRPGASFAIRASERFFAPTPTCSWATVKTSCFGAATSVSGHPDTRSEWRSTSPGSGRLHPPSGTRPGTTCASQGIGGWPSSWDV